MIPQAETAAIEQGNIDGERIALGISTDISHIMSVLTRLYSDEAMAVIREYSTNALDEHVEAGVTRPIEVRTPTALAPFLTIRDYGRGLSLDDLRAVYSQYGESTKRGTNAVTGMLGLGCKSGLAYAPTFNITSIHGGIKVLAQMKRNVEGGGEIQIIDTLATDEPTGVEIKIPCRDSWTMQSKANFLFSFWPADSVLLDGKAPERLTGVTVTDSAMIVDGLGSDYVVMGNVPYPVEGNKLSEKIPYGKHVVAVVPIGTVKPQPSREGLIYNEATNIQIARIEQEINAAMVEAAIKEVAQATTASDALRAANEWREILPRDYEWRGQTVPQTFHVQHWLWRPHNGRYSTSSDSKYYVGKNKHMEKIDETLFIHNFVDKSGLEYDEITSNHRRKIKDYLESLNRSMHDIRAVIISKDKIGDAWLDHAERIDWQASILPYRKPRDPNKVKNAMGQQPIHVFDRSLGYYVEAADDYEWEGPFILTTPADDAFPSQNIAACFPDHTIVRLGRGRYNKFERLFAEETEVVREYDYWTLFEDAKQGVVDDLTINDRILLAPPRADVEFAKKMRGLEDNLIDTETGDYLSLLNGATMTEAGRRYQTFSRLSDYRHAMPTVPAIEQVEFWERYPILSDLQNGYYSTVRASAANILDYMNALAIYKNKEKG
jgi:hypothetical protein